MLKKMTLLALLIAPLGIANAQTNSIDWTSPKTIIPGAPSIDEPALNPDGTRCLSCDIMKLESNSQKKCSAEDPGRPRLSTVRTQLTFPILDNPTAGTIVIAEGRLDRTCINPIRYIDAPDNQIAALPPGGLACLNLVSKKVWGVDSWQGVMDTLTATAVDSCNGLPTPACSANAECPSGQLGNCPERASEREMVPVGANASSQDTCAMAEGKIRTCNKPVFNQGAPTCPVELRFVRRVDSKYEYECNVVNPTTISVEAAKHRCLSCRANCGGTN
jgi:hypothetical protein